MTRPSKLSRAAWLRCTLAALLLAISACGGGVETGGTGVGAFVQGPISGFGSVIVAGVHFDDNCGCVQDVDGASLARDQLRLGMVVEVESGPIRADGSGGRTATATRVRLGGGLLGPVNATELDGTRLTVLGQPVRLTAMTLVAGVAGGAAALVVGDIVEVHGFFDAQASGFVATRVEKRNAAPAPYRVRGIVAEIDRSAKTLRIGTQVFDFSNIGGIPASLDIGQLVRLSLEIARVGGRWPVRSVGTEPPRPGDRDEVELEGLITSFDSPAVFSVNGVAVDAAQAVFPDDTAGLRVGVRVEVSGRTRAGVLVADSVEIESDDEAFNRGFDVRAQIESVDVPATTFTLRGITVFYGTVPPQRFENGTAADLLLLPPPSVRVRGTLSADRTHVIAERIEFINN